MKEASAQIQLSLTASSFNGYNISCFGASNGTLDLTITGGTPPYVILWSTNDTIEDLTGLPAGYYNVRVTDSDSIPLEGFAEITLIEPRRIEVEATVHKYPNEYNISVFDACNGMLEIEASEGVAPYTWLWSDGSVATTRSALCAGKYLVTVTDANNCKVKDYSIILTQPERSDWQLGGNEGTDPGLNFIGTVDTVDLVLKTTGIERMRITSDGRVGIGNGLIPQNYKLVVDGTAGFREVYVKLSGPWPDYVFNEQYQLMPLEDVEAYYRRHKHLPGMPSASEILTEGQKLGEIQRMQQEKIEELYLYILQLRVELDKLKMNCD